MKLSRGLIILSFFYLAACAQQGEGELYQEGPIFVEPIEYHHQYDLNTHPFNKMVCDPFADQSNSGAQDGLIAHLYYLKKDQRNYTKVADYFEHGTKSDKKFFFSTLEIPTIHFSGGFPLESGGVVENDEGEILDQFFALRFQSVLTLAEDQEPGFYELALLADDGAVMSVHDGNDYQVVVDNDGIHPTKMGCGDTIYIDKDTELDVQIDYFQGPRNFLALIPMWRKVDDGTAQEPNCGKKGNRKFFDFHNNSEPQQAYLDMLLRGWAPINSENWHLPPSQIYNPCTPGTLPEMSNIDFALNGDGSVTGSWVTDIPAASQILVRNANTGEEFLTDTDNILRRSHEIVVKENLVSGQTYNFQAISISGDLGQVLSRPFQLTIP